MKKLPWQVIRGAVFGGLIGWIPSMGAYMTLHAGLKLTELTRADIPKVVTLVACLTFSVRTVWLWGQDSWGEPIKAASLVVALEGLMCFGPGDWMPVVALCALVLLTANASFEHLAKRAAEKLAPKPVDAELSPVSPPSPVREPILPVPTQRRKARVSPA